MFKKTYELEVRRAGRLGLAVYLSLVTLHPEKKLEKGGREYLEIIKSGMDQMQEVLLLRFGPGM